MFDSGINMMSVLSDDTKTYNRTEFITSENSLNNITSNYFSSRIPGSNYKMSYVVKPGYDESISSAEKVAKKFNWVDMKVEGGGGAAGGAGAAAPFTILEMSDGTDRLNNLPQRSGPGVGVLASYINKYPANCVGAAIERCRGDLNLLIEQKKDFDTVRISELLAKSGNFSNMLKLCVDIKGGGDAEQVNAIWHLYHNKKQRCIMVTGDILCYMYSISMGLPSVLIASDTIYMSKGIPLGPIPESVKLKNKLNRYIALFNNILKSFSDLTNAGDKIKLLILNILNNVHKKISIPNTSNETNNFINALIQLKALDIVNFLIEMQKMLQGNNAIIIGKINTLLQGYEALINAQNNIFTFEFKYELADLETPEKQLELNNLINNIEALIPQLEASINQVQAILGNFLNKKVYNGSTTSFYNGIISTEFYKGSTTIDIYPLFDYNRKKIVEDISETIKLIKNTAPPAAGSVKNERFYLGNKIRGILKSYFSTFYVFKLAGAKLPIGIFGGEGENYLFPDGADISYIYTTPLMIKMMPHLRDEDIQFRRILDIDKKLFNGISDLVTKIINRI
jgi:hypothetical protein